MSKYEFINCPIPKYKGLNIDNPYLKYDHIKKNPSELFRNTNICDVTIENKTIYKNNSIPHGYLTFLQFKRDRIELPILNLYLIKDISNIISDYLCFIQIKSNSYILNITNIDTFVLPGHDICPFDSFHFIGECDNIIRRETRINYEDSLKLVKSILRLNIEIDDNLKIVHLYNTKTKKLEEVNPNIKIIEKSFVCHEGSIQLFGIY